MSFPRLKFVIVLTIALLIFVPQLPLRIIIPKPVSASSITLWGRVLAPNGWGFTSSSVSNPGPNIVVPAGSLVTLSLFSGDGNFHIFCVDYEAIPDFMCQTPTEPQSAAFTSSTTATTFSFSATLTPGNYTYYCTIHTSAMEGKFVVTGIPPGGGGRWAD